MKSSNVLSTLSKSLHNTVEQEPFLPSSRVLQGSSRGRCYGDRVGGGDSGNGSNGGVSAGSGGSEERERVGRSGWRAHIKGSAGVQPFAPCRKGTARRRIPAIVPT